MIKVYWQSLLFKINTNKSNQYINIIYFLSISLMFSLIWHERATGIISIRVALTFVIFHLLCFIFGNAFFLLTSRLTSIKADIVFQYVVGYFIFNTLFFIITLVSPLGIYINLLIISLASLLLIYYISLSPYENINLQNNLPAILCVTVSGIASTIWCNDAHNTMTLDGQSVIFKTWQDTFIHVKEISSFAYSHGIDSIYNIGLNGVGTKIYHYASYISSSIIYSFTGASAIEVYSSFQLPFGIFLTGLAAYSLIVPFWGKWPGLAATVAVVAFPDAYQQGFGNRLLSYNFLAQVNLGMLYGLACISIAWAFMINGCIRGNYYSVLIAYAFTIVTLFYKAHFFVANSFLILLYPCFFFSVVQARWRIMIGIVFSALYFTIINLSQKYDNIPTLRLDGSGFHFYLNILINNYDQGIIKDFFNLVLYEQLHAKIINIIVAVLMLLLSTYGFWLLIIPIGLTRVRKVTCLPFYLFPIFIITNYIIMSYGLAIDSHKIGMPEEFLNRPMVWAYFSVITWTAGGLYFSYFGDSLPVSTKKRIGLLIIVCTAVIVLPNFSKNLQTFPVWKGFASFQEFNTAPVCLVRASQYIREQSSPNDIIQDSENDIKFIVTALAERQIFVADHPWSNISPEFNKRIQALNDFKNNISEDEVLLFAKENNISWYILQPISRVQWPKFILEKPVFVCDGYRVYNFPIIPK